MMGYSYTGAQPCSMCKENSTDLSMKCMSMIDCLATNYPCTGNCYNSCLNANGDAVVGGCANALLTAASCQ
jgi:hypothetical protein